MQRTLSSTAIATTLRKHLKEQIEVEPGRPACLNRRETCPKYTFMVPGIFRFEKRARMDHIDADFLRWSWLDHAKDGALEERLQKHIIQDLYLPVFPSGSQQITNSSTAASQHLANKLHADCSILTPIKTYGDGNCLNHSVSRAIWGISDTKQLLRATLAVCFWDDFSGPELRSRARRVMEQRDAAFGIDITDREFELYWSSVVAYSQIQANLPRGTEIAADRVDSLHKCLSNTCETHANVASIIALDHESSIVEKAKLAVNKADAVPPGGPSAASLEDIHVFALAQCIRRPIIVYGEPTVRGQENNFVGVYLPLCWDSPDECWKSPIALLWHQSHFVPLVFTEQDNADNSTYYLPLMRVTVRNGIPSAELLPVQFLQGHERPGDSLSKWLSISINDHGYPMAKCEFADTFKRDGDIFFSQLWNEFLEVSNKKS